MKQIFAILLFTVFTFQASLAAAPEKWKCGKDSENKVDDLVSRIFIVGRDDIKFPENKVQLKDYCKDQTKSIAKIEQFKDQCLKERSKQTVAVVIYSLKSMVNSYCKNPNSKKVTGLLGATSCANRINDHYYKCITQAIDMFYSIKSMADSKGQLAQMCCTYLDAIKCFSRTGTKKGCSEKDVDIHVGYLRSIFDNAVNVLCNDYNESTDRCDKLKRVESKPKARRPKSIYSPVVSILANI